MALLDFCEIPEAGKATGKQDSFELFAREVLEAMGFSILQGPARGADGGKDIIVEETRPGLLGTTRLKWLVSCKHFAFSGKSVRPEDEKNIFERVSAAKCQGFIGFYSTLASSGLSELLIQQTQIQSKLFDHEEIERHLISSPAGPQLIKRYFPVSAAKLKHSPPELFEDPIPIECDSCGKDLLNPPSGIWVLWWQRDEDRKTEHYVDAHFACKGECDRLIASEIRTRHFPDRVCDRWDDIPDIAIPTVFITKVMGFLNGLVSGRDRYEPEAIDKVKSLLLATFPLVSRHLNDEDEETLKHLRRIPSYMGGMGYDN